MSTPTLIFIPGSWHKPACFEKVIKPLQNDHNVKCISIALPSTQDNPQATFKDDIDTAREAIISETFQGHDVIVIAHSYGGMVGNSAIKGLTKPKSSNIIASSQSHAQSESQTSTNGYVTALILIASGFTITGFAFMDPLCGMSLPFWRSDKETGYAVLVAKPRDFFYHDVPEDEANYWVGQLTTQSLKALFEGGEYAYAGWQDVPTWYIGTAEDRGLPVALQRLQVGVARGTGAVVYHTELQSSHSPFLSMPDEVVEIIMEAVKTASGTAVQVDDARQPSKENRPLRYADPMVRFGAPSTWFTFGIPLLFGRMVGWSIVGFMGLKRFWSRK